MTTTPTTFPWSVLINPDWYDDPADTGFAWSGEASGYEDAVNQALAACWSDNDRDDSAPTYDPDLPAQDGFTVFSADIDFRELAAGYVRARRRAAGFSAGSGDRGLLGLLKDSRDAYARLDAAFKTSGRDA